MHKRGLCRRAVSVCPSVTFVYSVKTNKHIFNVFHHMVAMHHYDNTLWQYSDKDMERKARFSTNIWLWGRSMLDHFDGGVYRVAQIKIPHRTKRNFLITVWDFYTQIFWFIWEKSCYNSEFFFENYFSFLQSYGYINILCHIFSFARNNHQQLVIFIVTKHW